MYGNKRFQKIMYNFRGNKTPTMFSGRLWEHEKEVENLTDFWVYDTEHLPYKQRVGDSILSTPTILNKKRVQFSLDPFFICPFYLLFSIIDSIAVNIGRQFILAGLR
jgi:hypothetical protein